MKRAPDPPWRTKELVSHFVRREVVSMDENDPLVRVGLDAEGIHQLRVSARRLRSELRAMRDVLPREPWTSLSDDLRWVGTTLGGLRDLDVLREVLENHVDPRTELHTAMTAAFDVQWVHHRRKVVRLLESSRYARVRRRLAHLSRDPGLGDVGRTSAAELFTPVLWSATCRYLGSIGDPDVARTDAELHRVRIASKQCRYNFEIGSVFLGDPAHAVARHLAAVQDVLGRVHDLVVAASFLTQLGRDHDEETAPVHVALRAEIDQLRPQWPAHFSDARRGMLDIFAGVPLVDD